MRRIFPLLIAAALAAGLAGCSGEKDDCRDVVRKACAKLYECGYRYSVDGEQVNEDACVSVNDNLATALSDGECRDRWKVGDALACERYDEWWLI